MIQRIQSLYLLLAAVCAGAVLLLPLAAYTDGMNEYTLRAFMLSESGGEASQPTVYMGILLSLSALLPFVTIFLFKRRMLQVRLCVVELVLLAGGIIMMAVYCYLGYRAVSGMPFGAASLKAGVILPLPAIVFTVLALRATFRDEVLVRSLDRIR